MKQLKRRKLKIKILAIDGSPREEAQKNKILFDNEVSNLNALPIMILIPSRWASGSNSGMPVNFNLKWEAISGPMAAVSVSVTAVEAELVANSPNRIP